MKLEEKALLVQLKISRWSANRIDKQISRDVAVQHQTSLAAGWYRKNLLPHSREYESITSAESAIRTYHYDNTLPWMDGGVRILPSRNFMAYSDTMRKLQEAYKKTVESFLAAYPALVSKAQRDLNGMFKPSDYPVPENLEKHFNTQISILPVPTVEDFRVQLSAEQTQWVQEQAQAQIKESIQGAVADLWTRIRDVLQRMVERLSEPDAIFRDSLIQNVKDLTHSLDVLNLTDDPSIAEVRKEIMALTRHGAETLRNNKTVRHQVAVNADSILKKMSAYMGGGNGHQA